MLVRTKFKFNNNRGTERQKLTGLLPGRLKMQNVEVSCRPLNVSTQGLGIVVMGVQRFKEGTPVELIMEEETIQMKVAWVQQDFGKKDMWRYGLMVVDTSIDLTEVFFNYGCLK